MTNSRVTMITLGTAVILGSCTTQPAPGPGQAAAARGGQCFLANEVNSWSPGGSDHVDIQVGANRYYRLQIAGCPDLNWNMRVGLRTTGGGSYICQGFDAEIFAANPLGPQRCPVTSITPITKDQFYAGRHG